MGEDDANNIGDGIRSTARSMEWDRMGVKDAMWRSTHISCFLQTFFQPLQLFGTLLHPHLQRGHDD